ncbi:hypothetical protein E2562_006783, partial [Oryza meyeriana var. granulata]
IPVIMLVAQDAASCHEFLLATDYEPFFVNGPSYYDEKRENYRHLVIKGTEAQNRLLFKMRELQGHLQHYRFIDIDDKMNCPS